MTHELDVRGCGAWGIPKNQPGWLTLSYPNLIANNLPKKSGPFSGVNNHVKICVRRYIVLKKQ